MWLLRGGTVLKVEHRNVTGMHWKSWIFIDEINLLTSDKHILEEDKRLHVCIIGEDKQLVKETHFQVDHFEDAGSNM